MKTWSRNIAKNKRVNVKRIIVLLILFDFLIFSYYANDGYAGEVPDEFSPGSILDFTKTLISGAEYYRAYTELRRLNSFYPDFITPLQFFSTKTYLLFQGKKYDEITKTTPSSGKPADSIDVLFRSDSFIMLGDLKKNDALISSWKFGEEKYFDEFFFKRNYYSAIMQRQWDRLARLYKEYPSENFNTYNELRQYAQSGFGKMKNPALAAVIGIVPGMGYVYAGEIGTGIVAFLLISACTIISYFSFQTGNYAIGICVSAIDLFFYSGSIVGSYLAAKKFNAAAHDAINGHLIENFNFDKDREYIYNNYGIGTIETRQ